PVYEGNIQLVRLLIRAGVDVNVERRQKYGLADLSLLETAIQERAGIRDTSWLGDLQRRGANEIRARDAKRSTEFLEIIKELLRAGADPNRVTVDMTPIYRATKANDLAVVKLLLKAGGDPNKAVSQIPWKKVYQENALHCAAKEGFLEIARAL